MKVSVIIPTYNCAPYLPDAIFSVLQQTHNNFEIIVIDDGSTDNTEEIIQPFLDRVEYIKQENHGVSVARNTGMKRATGDFIAFLDADDMWFPQKLAVQLNIFINHPDIAGVFSDFSLCNKHGDITHERFVTRNYHIFNYYKYTWEKILPNRETVVVTKNGHDTSVSLFHGDVFRSLYIGNFINTSSTILKREVLNTIGYFTPERRTQEDYEYWLKIAQKYNLAYLDTPLLRSRRRPHQLTSKSEIFDIVQQSLEVIETIGVNNVSRLGKNLVARRLTDKYQKLALVHLSQGNSKGARECIRKCIKWKPFSYKNIVFLTLSYIPSTFTNTAYRFLKGNSQQ
jgi:glycosyltransferase involved in cell wall biosynthesis